MFEVRKTDFKLKANVLQVVLRTPLDKIVNQVPVLILPLALYSPHNGRVIRDSSCDVIIVNRNLWSLYLVYYCV